MQRSILLFASLAIVAIYAVEAEAVDPDVQCQSSKVKVTGKYSFCRLKAESKALKLGTVADVSKCEAKFTEKFTGLESKAGVGVCPTEGDDAAIDAVVKKFAQGVLEELKYPV